MTFAVQPRAALASRGLASARALQRSPGTAGAALPSSGRHLSLSCGRDQTHRAALSPRQPLRSKRGCAVRVVASASAAGSFGEVEEDPYQVLGLTPLDSFDKVKAEHRKKVRAAEASRNEAELERIERAYDKIMMQQLNRRQKGLTFGSVQVSKDIKYADSRSLIPWGPKYERSPKHLIYINAAVSVLMALWAFVAQTTDWKILQILLSFYVFTLFIKLEPFYPAKKDDEEKPWARNGRRLVRSLGLGFGCLAVASLAHYAAIKAYSLLGFYVPRALLTFQEMLITVACSFGLFVLASYYR